MMIKAGHSWRVAKLWEGWTGQTLWEGVGWVGRRRSFQGPLCDRELVSVCVCVCGRRGGSLQEKMRVTGGS